VKALVIDPSRIMRIVLQRLLTARGFEVVDAGSWRQAVHSSETNVPDLVLMDWDLRNPEALEFVSFARRLWERESLFVMLVNVPPEPKTAFRAMMAGVDHFLVKPFTSSQLDAKLLDRRLGGRV
jgi:DNA-binding response OmpR family regulator